MDCIYPGEPVSGISQRSMRKRGVKSRMGLYQLYIEKQRRP